MVNFSVSLQGWGKMEDKIKLNWESVFRDSEFEIR